MGKWLSSRKHTMLVKKQDKENPSITLVVQTGIATIEVSMNISQKTEYRPGI